MFFLFLKFRENHFLMQILYEKHIDMREEFIDILSDYGIASLKELIIQ